MLFLLLAILFSCQLSAIERIKSFHSDITIHPDSTMTVKETIKVKSENDRIRRGIFRSFPTKYKDNWGNKYVVGFDVLSVLKDGKEEPYHIESVSNGKKVYIGSENRWVSPGEHTYTIEYKTNRQLGFFDDHDELYWNVTGNGWIFPIDNASAIVSFPAGVDVKQVKLEGYTGYQGEKGQHYTASMATEEIPAALFNTTRRLNPNEGLTIVTSFPKGTLTPPSFFQKWVWFFSDNAHIFILFLGALLLILFSLWASRRVRKTQVMDTVIPLFYPPEGMSPGLVRYILRMGYDSKVLAADIVDMAVKGMLTIEYKKKFLSAGYTLHKKELPDAVSPLYFSLFHTLFSKKDSIEMAQKNSTSIQRIIDLVEKEYGKQTRGYFDYHGWYTAIAAMIGIFFGLASFLVIDESGLITLAMAVLYLIIVLVLAYTMRGYTPKGLSIKKEIEGFKMFLATTEEERLKIIGTPPTRTPELYETYLPYAIALGVEHQWSAQFAPLFEKMAERGNPYLLIWYSGLLFDSFQPSRFSSNLSSSISSSIASSSSSPGSSSGSGGGGSSGGGGGGGGGGGW